jgi:hypothetical protein
MRNLLPIALLLTLAACASPTRWEKPGVSEETKESDLTICRHAAARQGLAYYPSAVNAPPGWAYQQQWDIMDTYSDDFRYHADFQLTAACMRYKGYEKVPVSN